MRRRRLTFDFERVINSRSSDRVRSFTGKLTSVELGADRVQLKRT